MLSGAKIHVDGGPLRLGAPPEMKMDLVDPEFQRVGEKAAGLVVPPRTAEIAGLADIDRAPRPVLAAPDGDVVGGNRQQWARELEDRVLVPDAGNALPMPFNLQID